MLLLPLRHMINEATGDVQSDMQYHLKFNHMLGSRWK